MRESQRKIPRHHEVDAVLAWIAQRLESGGAGLASAAVAVWAARAWHCVSAELRNAPATDEAEELDLVNALPKAVSWLLDGGAGSSDDVAAVEVVLDHDEGLGGSDLSSLDEVAVVVSMAVRCVRGSDEEDLVPQVMDQLRHIKGSICEAHLFESTRPLVSHVHHHVLLVLDHLEIWRCALDIQELITVTDGRSVRNVDVAVLARRLVGFEASVSDRPQLCVEED